MSTPSTVIQRANLNDFVAETGMLVSGVTGFTMYTGFYLTNSGNYTIDTAISTDNNYLDSFDYPEGKSFEILPGQHKFIPIAFTFIGDDQDVLLPPPSGPSGPYDDGQFVKLLTLSSKSTYNGVEDFSGNIKVRFTGQVTGFGDLPRGGVGPKTSSTIPYPSGFKIKTDYALDGKQKSILRWYHPSTGHFLTRYDIERAIGNTESATWAHHSYFNIYYDTLTVSATSNDTFTCKKYGSSFSGLAQLNNYDSSNPGSYEESLSPYATYTIDDLSVNTDYYYRVKAQYIDTNGAVAAESEYVYGYPVTEFTSVIIDEQIRSDVNNGLISGSTSLQPDTDPQNIIKVATQGAAAMYINIPDGSVDVNLKTLFDTTVEKRGISLSDFDVDSADRLFTGVKFIVSSNYIIAGKDSNPTDYTDDFKRPAIEYPEDSIIADADGDEIWVDLELHDNCKILGQGGKGGIGGYSQTTKSTAQSDRDYTLLAGGYLRVNNQIVESSRVGGSGGSAIYIANSSIAKFKILKSDSAIICGGGGGGGGGDITFWPKAMQFLSPRITQDGTIYPRRGTEVKSANRGDEADPRQGGYSINTAISGDELIKTAKTADDLLTIWLYDSTSGWTNARIGLTFNDIFGRYSGGVGGGGQSGSLNYGGYSLNDELINLQPLNNFANGNQIGYGYPRLEINESRLSLGGRGGSFGSYGRSGPSNNMYTLFNQAYNTIGTVDTQPARGGRGGSCIHLTEDNPNYSSIYKLVKPLVSNDSTRVIKDINSTNYPSLIAYFNANEKLYDYNNALITAAGSKVNKWESVNNSAIYLQAVDGLTVSKFFGGEWQNSADVPSNDGNGNYSRPQISVLKAFRNNRSLYFKGTLPRMQLTGCYGSGRLNNSMESFEIAYFLMPANTIDEAVSNSISELIVDNIKNKTFPQFGPFHQYTKYASHSMKSNEQEDRYMGWALHQFNADNRVGFYYSDSGFIEEPIGLPTGYLKAASIDRRNVRTATNTSHPVRPISPILYSISGERRGSMFRLSLYQNGSLTASTAVSSSYFNFLQKPMIGGTYSAFSSWYGNISDIMIFNKSLSDAARADLYYKFASQKMGMLATSNISLRISTIHGPGPTRLPYMNDFAIYTCNTNGNGIPASNFMPSGISHIPIGTIIYHPTAILMVTRRTSTALNYIYVIVTAGYLSTFRYNNPKFVTCTMQLFPSGRSQDQLNSIVNHKGFIGPLQGPSSWSVNYYQ